MIAMTIAHQESGWPFSAKIAQIPLYSDGIAVAANGDRTLLPAQSAHDGATPSVAAGTNGTNSSKKTRQLTPQESAWLAEGTIPGRGTDYEDMATRALLDLHALTLPVTTPIARQKKATSGIAPLAAIAAWTPHWHYVWPRDASFAAVAFARTGHVDEALGTLVFLSTVQHDDGTFEARYLPDASGRTPDARAAQSDGAGWVLWATEQVLSALPASRRAAAWTALQPMATKARTAVLRLTNNGTTLPPASPDYWEVPEDDVTLGTAAPLLAGLEAAGQLFGGASSTAAVNYRHVVQTTFGTRGFPRRLSLSGWSGAQDSASAFVLRPYVSTPLDGAEEAWRDSQPAMLRPAGGLAPGGSWRKDGISWTPTTSLYALAAASNGDRPQAEAWLTWLDAHRTASGSLPEKVLANGAPASVAPLSWTAANVLLALVELDQ